MGGKIVFVFILIIFLTLINKRWSIFLSYVVLLWLFSFRSNEIPDTDMYQWMYDDPISRIGFNEIGFLFIGYIFKALTNAEFIVYYITLVGLSCLLWYYGMCRILPNNNHWGMLLLIFISFYGFLYMGVIIRNCISELLILCGLSSFITYSGKKKYICYILFIILATLVHKTAILFMLLLPLFRMRISNRTFNVLFVIAIVVWMVSGVGLARNIVGEISKISMFSDYSGYATSTEASPNMFSLQVLMGGGISFCAIKNQRRIIPEYKKTYNCFLKINVLGLLLLSVIWALPTSYRFYNIFLFFNYVLIYLMIFQNTRITSRGQQILYSLSISGIYFFILLHSFPFLLLY